MIARLKGTVEAIGDDSLVVDVQGVGYLVFCAARTLARLPDVGQATALYVETHVREDRIQLYGFLAESERALFRLLTTVQGVGTKAALALLSLDAPERLWQALAAQDKAFFARAQGVGPKLAARLTTELKDKAAAHGMVSASPGRVGNAVPSDNEVSVAPGRGRAEEAVSALTNLGYGRTEAFGVVARCLEMSGAETTSVEELIALALRRLGREAEE